MQTNTAVTGAPDTDRAHIKRRPIAATLQDLRIKLSQLEDSGMADTPRGRSCKHRS